MPAAELSIVARCLDRLEQVRSIGFPIETGWTREAHDNRGRSRNAGGGFSIGISRWDSMPLREHVRAASEFIFTNRRALASLRAILLPNDGDSAIIAFWLTQKEQHENSIEFPPPFVRMAADAGVGLAIWDSGT